MSLDALTWTADFIKEGGEWVSEKLGFDATTAALARLEGLSAPDPTLKTAETAEVAIRNKLSFSDIHFTFPTTSGRAGREGMQRRISMPAYIQTFQDTYSPTWTTTPVFGRADPIPTYANTTRAITLSLLVPCFNKVDANENLRKLNTLIKGLYPGYRKMQTGANVLESPPLVRIKFANLLINHKNPAKGLLGYITSFSSDMGIKERGVMIDQAGTTGYLLSRALGINLSFSPLHESTIGWDNAASEGEFFGNENFPYDVKKRKGESVAPGDSKAGLGVDISTDHVTQEYG